ncbi:MAG: hypothetical protein OCC49_02635 [Fibrobacterales bacterium]
MNRVVIGVLLFVVIGDANIGFFDQTFKKRHSPTFYSNQSKALVQSNNSVVATLGSDTIGKILPTLFGNNTNGWIKQKWVDDSVAQQRLSDAGITFLRMPGGNWSNNWFWDGVIPSDLIEETIPELQAFAGDGSSWVLSSDAMITMAQNIGAEAQICVNYGYARYGASVDPVAEAAHYAAEWVRHVNDTLKAGVRYWEIGNENYGSWQMGYVVAGDTITGKEYGEDFRVFVDSMKAADPSIKIGAVLYNEDKSGAGTLMWNAGVLPEVEEYADYLIIHEYFTWAADYNDVSVSEMVSSMKLIGEDIAQVQTMVEKYTDKPADHFPIAMTEYNVRAGKKNEAHISGLLIAQALGEYATHGYGLVNLWDIANGWDSIKGDHGMFSRKDPLVEDFTPHPTFYAYYLTNRFFGDHMVELSQSQESNLSMYGTQFEDGSYGIVVVNPSDEVYTFSPKIEEASESHYWYWYEVTAPGNDPESPVIAVNGVEGDPLFGPVPYASIAPYGAHAIPDGVSGVSLESWSALYLHIRSDSALVKDVNIIDESSGAVQVSRAYESSYASISSAASLSSLTQGEIMSSQVGDVLPNSSQANSSVPLRGTAHMGLFTSHSRGTIYSLFGERLSTCVGVNCIPEKYTVMNQSNPTGILLFVVETGTHRASFLFKNDVD